MLPRKKLEELARRFQELDHLLCSPVAADRLLAETDCPYLAPQPIRGKPNEPAHVVHTVAALADVRGVDAEALAAQIDANADAAFSLPA